MGYSRFIEVGVERQNDSVTVDEATRNYARSCECCMKRGLNFGYDCDIDCPITVAHREKLDTIIALRQLEHEMSIRKEELRKKLDGLASKMQKVYEEAHCPSELDKYNDKFDKLAEEWAELKGGSLPC